ncbi:MAG TPA: carbon-nitrogen hydrolase family protein [bacterium]|nr:carbon-nitrogen hydrolase family protein [bacterium]
MRIRIATCQFPVDADVRRNARYVLRQMRAAKERGARVTHFPECALSGYAGADFASYDGFDWARLAACTDPVLDLARRLRLWVVLGSTHRLTGRHKPHNSLYIVDDRGAVVDRYDKRFCAGDRSGRTGDLAHYSPGDRSSVFTVDGVRCGALICHDYRYPELYREYTRRGVHVVFHSYHAGHITPKRLTDMREYVGARFRTLNRGGTLPGITMPATMVAAAATNHVWISCSNTSARESCWASFFVRPDGVVTGRLPLNRAGVLISTVDTREPIYDSTVSWRARAMRGVLHSGTLVNDRRSAQRTRL